MPEGTCPVCAERGEPVPGQTVKSLLTVSLRELASPAYRFCATRTCPVVYFSENGQLFTVPMVRERVYQKAPASPNTPVCYCFSYTVSDVSTPDQQAHVVRDIKAGIKANQCACDLRNPQGNCCLGNILAIERRSVNE